MNPYMKRVGRRVFDARTSARMTQQRLADCIGLTRSSVANIEGGRQSVDAVQLAQIARALGVALDVLVLADDLPAAPVLPHDVEIEPRFIVRCRTCAPDPFIGDVRTRKQAEATRDRHIAHKLDKEGAVDG